MEYKLKGHESFMPREGWLSKSLRLIKDNPRLFAEKSGADALGVGTNMGKSIKYWSLTAGLIIENGHHGFKLTELGRCIYDNDPYMEDLFTIWILHINIASNFPKASIWNVFFNANNLDEFSKEDMVRILSDRFSEIIGTDNFSEKSLADDCNGILAMYSKKKEKNYDPEDNRVSPFANLGLITKSQIKYNKKMPNKDKLNFYVVLYVLNNLIDEAQDKSINISDATYGNNGFRALLNLEINDVYEYLDELAAAEYIILNRTAGLDMIYMQNNISNIEILVDYYNARRI